MLETFKSFLLKLSPGPKFPFSSEQVKGSNDIGEILDEISMKIRKSSK